MSTTAQFLVGTGAIALAGQVLIYAVLPEPKPIVVHSIEYVDGKIVQDRTVTAEGDSFPAQWKAFIVDADTRLPVEECAGSGFWPYPSGRLTPAMDLAKWTGNDACSVELLREIGGGFYPVATWLWGNDSVTAQGAVFKP